VVSDPGKGATKRQVGTRKTFQKRPMKLDGRALFEASKI
jgi:hypothetical protein